VRAGEFCVGDGASGSGKSTLLNMLGALDKPTSGRFIIKGQDMSRLRDVDTFRAKTVGFIFSPQPHSTLSSVENVECRCRTRLESRSSSANAQKNC
jgi:ABC-type lipoprotein export system ATPase subunit